MKYKKRIWEIDFLRGIAFLLMAINHIIFNLNYFFYVNTGGLKRYELTFGFISAVLFMLLCGISSNLSKSNIKRSKILFLISMAITLITFLIDVTQGTNICIKFGILHFLALAMFISEFVKRLSNFTVFALAVIVFALGLYFNSISVTAKFLFPLGLTYNGFSSGDYYPLLPYLAYVFIGIIIGKTVYKKRVSIFKVKLCDNFINYIGRHALLFYLLHQPVLILVIWLIFKAI